MPVRSSTRTKAQEEALSTIDVRDVDFGHLWRQLVRVGWTSKRPTRLSNLHSYYSPNATKEPRVEGVNMFIANTVDALFGSESEDSDEAAERPLYATSPHIEGENTRLSQIDTSIALSANTIDDIFGGEDPDASPCVGRNGAGEPVTPTNSRRRDTVTGAVARTNSGVVCKRM
ncbi:hypothetical protein F441_22291 [Phytophthora nicotianae CJ01A1]|uniref:Uncharacterized protein n=2 Tax=Phytophthora nicotianae TaxID=4792 RepID=W2I0Y4_PHYNI|nr:hypothetical protein L915_18832 [Phytophthora nicotianae]ETL27791.1 hypothetical protein L916_18727 [Phytophthora nicotianae]ETP00288.1 hypothetical protein F441_22291 [Phytophthora nicotianae CJ01A1]